MQFPSAAPQQQKDFPIEVGSESFNVTIRMPNFAQRSEDEDRQSKSEELRIHRLRTCVQGWTGLEENGQPVPFSIYKLYALIDARPEVLDQLNGIIDPLFGSRSDSGSSSAVDQMVRSNGQLVQSLSQLLQAGTVVRGDQSAPSTAATSAATATVAAAAAAATATPAKPKPKAAAVPAPVTAPVAEEGGSEQNSEEENA